MTPTARLRNAVARVAASVAAAWRAPEQRGSLENPHYSLDDPGVMDALWYDNGSLPPVRPQRAVQTAAVYACVRVLSQAVATLPLHTYRRGKDGGRELADGTDVYRLLFNEPNPFQTAYQFREAGMAQAALWGNFYAEIQRDLNTGRPIALYPLPAWEVQPELVRTATGIVKVFHVGGETIADENIFHVPALGWDGVKGISPIALNRASITMSLNAEEFGANFMKNGTRLSGALKHPGKLSKEAAQRLRDSWQDTYAGKANAGKVAVLEEGLEFSSLSMPLADAQYLENRRFQVTDIARIFGVPPHKIADLTQSTNNNIEHQGKEFLSDTLRPWLARWEQECNRKLFPGILKNRYYARFDVSDILRGDMASRYAAYAIGRQWGWLSANDVRRMEDMNAIDDGDLYLVPLNMVPADKAADQAEADEAAEPPEPGEAEPGSASDTPTPGSQNNGTEGQNE